MLQSQAAVVARITAPQDSPNAAGVSLGQVEGLVRTLRHGHEARIITCARLGVFDRCGFALLLTHDGTDTKQGLQN